MESVPIISYYILVGDAYLGSVPLLNTLFCHQKCDFKAIKCGEIESLLYDCGLLAWSDPRTKLHHNQSSDFSKSSLSV
jgi:hypothetical protein